MGVLLEPATSADLRTITEYLRAWVLDAEDLEPGQFLVARDGGRLVGFGRLRRYEGGVYEVSSVGVLPDRRGEGIGRTLVRALLERVPTAQPVVLITDIPEFFARLGFEVTPDVPDVLEAKRERFALPGAPRCVVTMRLVRSPARAT